MRENDFQREVIDLARSLGWLCYHTYDSRRSPPGFPDIVAVRVNKDETARLLFAELKVGNNTESMDQIKWLGTLACVPGLEVYIWRPEDLDRPPTIREILERGE